MLLITNARGEMSCLSRLDYVIRALVRSCRSHGFERLSRILHGQCAAIAVGHLLHGDDQIDIGVWVYGVGFPHVTT